MKVNIGIQRILACLNNIILDFVNTQNTIYTGSRSNGVYKSTDNGNTWTSISYAAAPTISGFNAYGFDKIGNSMMCVGTYGEMVKSTNSGANWATLLYRRSLANLNGDLYVQSSTGRIIAVGDDQDQPDAILDSPDGGQSWFPANFNISSYCSAIFMINPTTGYVCGRWGLFYKTTNGGKSWVSVWTLAGSFPDGIKMFTPSYGIFIGDPTGTGQPYQFRYTKDSGSTWQLSPTAPIATSEFGVINAFDFIDTNRIWVGSANTITTDTTAKIYRTRTGINGTWTYSEVSGLATTSGFYWQAIAFVDSLNGMAGSNSGNIIRTTDGGVTWTPATIPSGLKGAL